MTINNEKTEQEITNVWFMNVVDFDDPRAVRTETECWELIEAHEAAERASNQAK